MTPPDDDLPREGGDELLYLLVIDPQAGSHRLHRFTPALEYQTLQIQPAFAPLVPADQRDEDLRDELLECSAHPRDLIPSYRKRPTPVETPTTRANEVLLTEAEADPRPQLHLVAGIVAMTAHSPKGVRRD